MNLEEYKKTYIKYQKLFNNWSLIQARDPYNQKLKSMSEEIDILWNQLKNSEYWNNWEVNKPLLKEYLFSV